uniref:acetyl-CoA carboxylase carboxyltransferase beta n=1 Tax=Goniothalamus tamirensis TaxID=553657 RepID=UPI0022FDA974|nr:acetyl-CoA carboxylase carboxyltransferase beta [Goniothalamus tamirensis]WBF98318.1 acetyl-CoA carboxylase carboxyltransferase beta [Goniothalamus tamirensis]
MKLKKCITMKRKKYGFGPIYPDSFPFFYNRPFKFRFLNPPPFSNPLSRKRISKPGDSLIRTIGSTGGGEYPVPNDTDKNIHSWNNHNQSCIDGYLCSQISSGGDGDSGKSINDNDIKINNDSDERGAYYLNRTYLHTENYTDYIDQYKYSDESLDSVDNDSHICNEKIINGSDNYNLNGFQDFKHLWVLCEECYVSNYKENLKSNLYICEYCGFHLKMNSSDRIELSVDSGTWEPMDEDLISIDPIDFDAEEVKDLEKSEWVKEFKELFDMLDEIEEKEGAEKREAAEKLKEWEGWEKLKKKDKEEKVEGWKKQWNDWEDWGKEKEDEEKLPEILLEIAEDYLKKKKTKKCKEIRRQEIFVEKVLNLLEEGAELEEFKELFEELKEQEELERAEEVEEEEEWQELLEEVEGAEEVEEEEEEEEEEEWQEIEKVEEVKETEKLRKRLGERKELLALFQKLLRINFEWWKGKEGIFGLFEEGGELEEFKELFEGLKELKESVECVKEMAEVVELEGAEEVEEEEEEEWQEIEEVEEVKETEKAEEVEEAEEVKETEKAEEVEEVKEIEEVEEVKETEKAEEVEEVKEIEEVEEVKEIEEVEEVKETEKAEEVEEEEEEEWQEIEEVEEVKEIEELEEVKETEKAEEVEEMKETEKAEEVEEMKETEKAEEVEEAEEVKEQSYLERLDSHQRETGLNEAVQTGIGQINGFVVAMGFMDFEFIGGSMGSVVGEKITRLIEYATKNSMPLIMVCASGGARMQEGTLSLMQMAKISSVLNAYQLKRKLFYVSILTTPTTGGVTASFGMLGDVIIAEPNAHIAFAGKIIIEQLLNVIVPEGVQEAEYSFVNGLLDSIVPRNTLKGVLSELFQLHGFFSWSWSLR